MSEHQYYEFVAVDRPLTSEHIAELRGISTRAEISSTRFRNTYHWGDLKADPAQLLARYFDAHLYTANWGAHRLMLRLPAARVDVSALKLFFAHNEVACLTHVGDHVVLDFSSDDEAREYDDEHDNSNSLATFAPLRAELMRGDLRPAYLAWLLAVQCDYVDDSVTEPPVPTGLATLTSAQTAMAEFLRIDADLLAAAALASTLEDENTDAFRSWLDTMSDADKQRWLRRAVEDLDLPLGGEMLRVFRATQSPATTRRTVGELRAQAYSQRIQREAAEAARAEQKRRAAAEKRQRRLAVLAEDVDGAWTQLEKLVTANSYDDAVRLAVDLRDIAARAGDSSTFAARFDALRKRQSRRRGFFDRWKRQSGASN